MYSTSSFVIFLNYFLIILPSISLYGLLPSLIEVLFRTFLLRLKSSDCYDQLDDLPAADSTSVANPHPINSSVMSRSFTSGNNANDLESRHRDHHFLHHLSHHHVHGHTSSQNVTPDATSSTRTAFCLPKFERLKLWSLPAYSSIQSASVVKFHIFPCSIFIYLLLCKHVLNKPVSKSIINTSYVDWHIFYLPVPFAQIFIHFYAIIFRVGTYT